MLIFFIIFYLPRRDDVLESKLKFKSVETTMTRLKAKKYPTLPKNINEIEKAFEDVCSTENFGKSLTGKEKFHFHTEIGKGSVQFDHFNYEITIYFSQINHLFYRNLSSKLPKISHILQQISSN